MERSESTALSILWRSYIYAVNGFATEILFTAFYNFVFHLDGRLIGQTSVWIIPIYALSGLMCEQIYIKCAQFGLSLPVRGLVYLMWTYFWEFTTGFILKQFDMCPWDYTHYPGDFMGLITLEYAPLWYILGLIIDQFVLPFTFSLYWGPVHSRLNVNGQKSQ